MDLRSVAWNQVRDLSVRVVSCVLALVAAVVLLSVVRLPDASWSVRLIVAAFCLLAVVRPADALLVAAALFGFGIILSHLAALPVLRVSDVLVAASLGGCCVRALRDSNFRSALSRHLSVPLVLFAATVVVSTVVWMRVYQIQSGDVSAYLSALVHFASRDYFVRPGEFWLIVSTVAILQGLALYVVAAAWCETDATFFDRGLRMLTIGGAGVAAMSVVRLGEILLRNPQIVEQLRNTYDGLRISPQIPDYIAAGSYFSLCWITALGLAIASVRYRVAWLVAAVPLAAGLYLTGSRSVVAAALGGVVVLIFILFVRQRAAAFRGVVAVAVAAVIIMIGGFRWMVGHDVAGKTARASLSVRAELLRAGLRVIETRPLFGVGIDRFHVVAGSVKSPVLEALWQSRRNPHNDFVRVGGELGLVGLALFLAILVPAGRRIWRALRTTADASLAGLTGGLVAFLITSMVSNPLMLREVSYVFWMALGLAVGRAAALQPAPESANQSAVAPSARSSKARSSLALVLGALLLVSVPFRAQQELTTVDPTRVSYGLSVWEREHGGTRFRWSGPDVTLYVSGRARRVEIPLSGTHPSGAPQHVTVHLNGRTINDIAVGSDWQRLGILLQLEPSSKPRRIDLTISPTWVRSDVTSGSDDRSVVGVKVGELNVIL